MRCRKGHKGPVDTPHSVYISDSKADCYFGEAQFFFISAPPLGLRENACFHWLSFRGVGQVQKSELTILYSITIKNAQHKSI